MICKLKNIGNHLTPVWRRSQKIVTDEDENRKMAAEALKKLDEEKLFIEVNGNDHLNMIFNELIENVGQMKLKIKNKVIEVSLDLKICFIYTGHSYRMKKILHLNPCCLFLPKNPKVYIAEPGYSGHFFRNRRCPIIKLKFSGLSYFIYRNNFANSY